MTSGNPDSRDQFADGQVVAESVAKLRPTTFDPAHPRYHGYEASLILAQRVNERLGDSTA